MENKKNKKKIYIISGIIIGILILTYIIIDVLYLNYELLEVEKSMVTKQFEIEKEFTSKGYTIDEPNVILDPYKVSPLTALVIFETETEVTPRVTIKGKDNLTTFTHLFGTGKTHYLTIYGLYPDKENEVVIEFSGVSKTLKIKTNPLPDDFIKPTSVKADKSKLSNELYFFTPSSKGYTCAYDVNGDVRWYLTNYALWETAKLDNGHILISTERRINSPYYMTGLYEIDFLGKIYNEYSIPGGYHHDYFEMPNGNILVASDDFISGDGTVEDYVVEIDRKTGKVVKEFDVASLLKKDDGKSENWSEYDWFHNNSVWYDKKTNSITLSGRHQDAVINIDYATKKLNWIIGDPTNWSEEYQKYFFTPKGKNFEWQWSQHAAMITPEGYVFILDNGNNKSKIKEEYVSASKSYTRGVMYKIDTENMTIEQVWEYGKNRGSEFYSPYISDVDYIAKNHYIVHSGGIVYVDGKNSNQPAGISGYDKLVSDTVELLNNKVIFEIKLPTNNYRVEKMSLYDVDTKYRLDSASRLGSLGITESDGTSLSILSFPSKIDDEYNSHNISFTNEEDRIVFTGQFKRGTDVNVVLYKKGLLKKYNVQISKKPYTALCVDVFTDEENENGIVVTKYINKEGLRGNYSLYLEIDGKLYNTERYVEF